MRILTWNVNGWKKIRTYQPFFSLQSWSAILAHLKADIVCLQETKLTRKQAITDREMCLPGEGWESFWDFHPSRGYSGTATYVDTKKVPLPAKYEQGLTGRKVHDSSQRIGAYPLDCKDELDDALYTSLDEEGRSTCLDFGMFVLFNLYCPVMGSEERADFRAAFYATLDERARNLIAAGREVIIVGDINIARQPIDHCDYTDLAEGSEDRQVFFLNTARAWLNRFTQPQGPFHDVQREAFASRKGMYTCWSTLINARPSNYGTRIDYTLVSPGLRDWVKAADIQNDVPGSDHCPVWVDLHDERVIDGKAVKLRDLMTPPAPASAPPAAASRWEEFNRKDLKSFFAKAKAAEASGKSKMEAFEEAGAVMQQSSAAEGAAQTKSAQPDAGSAASPSHTSSPRSSSASVSKTQQSPSPSKLVQPRAKSNSASGKKETASGSNRGAVDGKKAKQLKLGAFFGGGGGGDGAASSSLPDDSSNGSTKKRRVSTSASPPPASHSSRRGSTSGPQPSPSPTKSTRTEGSGDADIEEEPVDWDYLASLPDPEADRYSQSSTSLNAKGSSSSSTSSTTAWSSLFTAPPPPRCPSHQEPAKSYRVNKRDSKNNYGRKFWLCSRDVGPGYEKGFASSEHGREGGEYRCGFFMWNSDYEREWRRKKEREKRVHGDVGG